MYRTYSLSADEVGKIKVLRYDGDTYYYDVFDSQEEYDEEAARRKCIDEECRVQLENYLKKLKGGDVV